MQRSDSAWGYEGFKRMDLPERICCCNATLQMHEQPHCGQSEYAQDLGFDFSSWVCVCGSCLMFSASFIDTEVKTSRGKKTQCVLIKPIIYIRTDVCFSRCAGCVCLKCGCYGDESTGWKEKDGGVNSPWSLHRKHPSPTLCHTFHHTSLFLTHHHHPHNWWLPFRGHTLWWRGRIYFSDDTWQCPFNNSPQSAPPSHPSPCQPLPGPSALIPHCCIEAPSCLSFNYSR